MDLETLSKEVTHGSGMVSQIIPACNFGFTVLVFQQLLCVLLQLTMKSEVLINQMKEGDNTLSKRILTLNTEVAALKAKESALNKQLADQKIQKEEDLTAIKASMVEECQATAIEAVELLKYSLEFAKEYVNGWCDCKVECIRANPEVNIEFTFVVPFIGSLDHSAIDPLVLGGQDLEGSRDSRAIQIYLVEGVGTSSQRALDGDQ